jgi:hypothetical protein
MLAIGCAHRMTSSLRRGESCARCPIRGAHAGLVTELTWCKPTGQSLTAWRCGSRGLGGALGLVLIALLVFWLFGGLRINI